MGLISSDVDKLIVTLKKNKYISLDDLVKKSGIAKEMVEEWLPVLEDSGYIKIVYQFTKIYIEWIEDSGAKVKVPGMDIGISEDEIEQNIISEDELPKPSEQPYAEQPEITPEPALAVHKKKKEMKLVDEKEVGKIKLKTIKRKPLKTVMMSTQDIKQSVQQMFDKKKSDTLSPYAEQLKQYLGEIDAAKKELEQMKQERAKLYSTIYEPMEKEFRAGYNTIAERIADKQKKILELQEEALKLPEMLEKVDRQQMKLHEIGERVKTVANESTNIINDSLEELQNLTDDSSKQTAMAKHAINQGARSITETQTLLQKIESVESDLSQRMADVEEKLRDEQDKLEKLAEIWQDMQKTKKQVVDKIEKSSQLIEAEKHNLKIIEEQVMNTQELMEWIKISQDIYKKRIEEFDNYVKTNETDYNKLRESIEANYLKMYMKDLSDLSKEYDSALSNAKEKEKSINEKISEAKKRITDLVRQSRELIEALEKGEITSADYEKIRKELKKKQNKESNNMKKFITERKTIAQKIKQKTIKKKKNNKKK